ncbi:MAG: nuclear transport factor 2 family protein [Candidatus Thorarchaeota archaeon]
MEYTELVEFINDWLDTWTGNRPNELIEFYATDALYQDPANPQGLRGKQEILSYFERLLKANPNWIWRAEDLFQIDTGVVLKWKCEIPVGEEIIIEYGLDIVEISDMKITRNEVYFDRTKLLAALARLKN